MFFEHFSGNIPRIKSLHWTNLVAGYLNEGLFFGCVANMYQELVFHPKTLYITYCNNIITKMNNTKILMHLLENKEKLLTINQISKDLNINYRIVHTQIKLLEKEKSINVQKAGKSLLCSLTNNFNEKIQVSHHFLM